MNIQEAKRIRRTKRLNTAVRLSKKGKKNLELNGERPVVSIKRIRNKNNSTQLPKRVRVPKKLAALFTH